MVYAQQGGMGLFFFKNATEGGDWIIQERLENDAFVSSLLPENAPLSTMRVISASRSDRTYFHLNVVLPRTDVEAYTVAMQN